MLPLALTAVLLLAELLNEARIAKGFQVFKRCYNASQEETHCFEVQYTNDQPLYTSFENADLRCRSLNSSLVTIKSKEIDTLIQRFMADSDNSIRERDIWLNAYEVNNYYNYSNRWHWLNTTVPDIPDSTVTYTYPDNYRYYNAGLEFRSDNGIYQFYLTAKQPQMSYYYVCEYSESNCSSASFNDGHLLINSRCYRAVKELVTWYEARNRCLNGGGDLASFANVSNVNFTSWLGTMPWTVYWIGLRYLWYTWGDSGSDVMYTNWATNSGVFNSPCLVLCSNCNPSYAWSSHDCSTWNTYVVCHSVATLQPTTTSETLTSTTPSALTSSGSKEPLSNSSLPPYQSNESLSSKRLAIGIGVGVGVGVPLIIAVIVIVTCIVLRRRRRRPTASSAQLNNNREEMESSSFDKPTSDLTVKAKNEIETSTYGTVVPSTLSRQLAEASGANSKSEPAEYAPLQFL